MYIAIAIVTICLVVIHGSLPQFGGRTTTRSSHSTTANVRTTPLNNNKPTRTNPTRTNPTSPANSKTGNVRSSNKSNKEEEVDDYTSGSGDDDYTSGDNTDDGVDDYSSGDNADSGVDDYTAGDNADSGVDDYTSGDNADADADADADAGDDDYASADNADAYSEDDDYASADNSDADDDSDDVESDPELDSDADFIKNDFLFGSTQYVRADNVVGDDRDLRIPYFCEGPLYDAFGQAMRDFAEEKVEKGEKPPHWGRRELPPNSKVLVFGQSHTRQVGMQLGMQHELPLPHTEVFDQHLSGKMARRLDLGHNRSLFVVANSYVAFSKDWKKLLERQIQFKMEDLDAVFVSVWNSCTSYVQTTFAKEMLEWQENLEDVDCAHIPGPTVSDIAEVYDGKFWPRIIPCTSFELFAFTHTSTFDNLAGPITFISMFARYRDDDIAVAKAEVEELQKRRDKVHYIDARQYINEMQMECGAEKQTSGGENPDCDHSKTAGDKYHRCIGELGGHPDMIAWDVNELVWKYMENR